MAKKEEVVLEPPKYDRAVNPPMGLAYMNQMTAMMILANLYNCSPGRDAKSAARAACEAADALVEVWIIRHKIGRKW